jgi:hypothetical protein
MCRLLAMPDAGRHTVQSPVNEHPEAIVRKPCGGWHDVPPIVVVSMLFSTRLLNTFLVRTKSLELLAKTGDWQSPR